MRQVQLSVKAAQEKRGCMSSPSSTQRCSPNKCRSTPRPATASRMSPLWRAAAARSRRHRSAAGTPLSSIDRAHVADSRLQLRSVSVRPCRNLAGGVG